MISEFAAQGGDHIPVEVIFNPNWWFHNYGISFDQSFYIDRDARIENDVVMRQAMYDRFGLGECDPEPRPIIGSMYVAGGFLMPALFGAEVRFAEDEAPCPVPLNLSREEILTLGVPDIRTTWPMNALIQDMDALERDFGYVTGDWDTDGIFNTALCIRGQQLFMDLLEDPALVHHLFDVLARSYVNVCAYIRARTGTCAVATNRSILNVDPSIYLHSNCSVQMISPNTYEEFLLPYERYLAERLRPYGIHHCGNNLHLFRNSYAELPAVFYDVGWGSDVFLCRESFPDAFLNLRVSPVRMLQETEQEIRKDTEQLLSAAGSSERVGVCCINMDYGTPDENVVAMMDTVQGFR